MPTKLTPPSTSSIDKTQITGLTPEKKKILKSLIGSSTGDIDYNKIREEENENH